MRGSDLLHQSRNTDQSSFSFLILDRSVWGLMPSSVTALRVPSIRGNHFLSGSGFTKNQNWNILPAIRRRSHPSPDSTGIIRLLFSASCAIQSARSPLSTD